MPAKSEERKAYLRRLAEHLLPEKGDAYWLNLSNMAVEAVLSFYVAKFERACANDYLLTQLLENGSFSEEDEGLLLRYYALMNPKYAEAAVENVKNKTMTAQNYMPVGSWNGISESWQGKELCLPMVTDCLLQKYLETRDTHPDDVWADICTEYKEEAVFFGYGANIVEMFEQILACKRKVRNLLFAELLEPLEIFQKQSIRERTASSDFALKYARGMRDEINGEWQISTVYMTADTKGLTTIAPTWFSIADTEGNMTSIASRDYVERAHQSGMDVWAVLRDFHGGISSYDETYQVLSYTSKRTKLIDQVIAAALSAGVDGINLDFELVSTECGEHYIQFVRELSVRCRQNELVFSVDNYVPQAYNAHYDLEEQGVVADYVIIMGYDEHTDSSYEAGSVASISYLENGIREALQSVPETRLIAGVPFYTRLWHETPKTEEELAEEAGTEAAAYPYDVTSEALGMDAAEKAVSDAGAQIIWDENTKQNYAEWEADGGTYRIWLEDEKSLEEKLKVIRENSLAGVAEWSLGMESSGVWDLILQYVNG